jgi:hypothetical protein
LQAQSNLNGLLGESHSADHRAASNPKKPSSSNVTSSGNLLLLNNQASLLQAGKPAAPTNQMYRTTNQLPQEAGVPDKNAELIRLKKEYHQMMLREL